LSYGEGFHKQQHNTKIHELPLQVFLLSSIRERALAEAGEAAIPLWRCVLYMAVDGEEGCLDVNAPGDVVAEC
jgi:hypothetical protein